jgi:carbon-monoxide dehydrogenase small subunit
MTKKPVQFELNGQDKAVFVGDGQNLLDVLRRTVGDLSPKYGCAQGTCGACTVLIDGEPHLSCLVLGEKVNGRTVSTTGGLATGGKLDPLQQSFMDHFAAQCGFCTGGMLMAAKALLAKNPNPSREDVVEAISGNICRCTGYEPIIEAILAASRRGTGGTGMTGGRP